MKLKFYGKVLNGKRIYANPDLYKRQIQALEGKEFVEVIEEKTNKPSGSQYNFYRGIILKACHKIEMFAHCESADEIHRDYFAPRFLTETFLAEENGKKREVKKPISMADLTDRQMGEVIDRIRAHCNTELGMNILSAEEYLIRRGK